MLDQKTLDEKIKEDEKRKMEENPSALRKKPPEARFCTKCQDYVFPFGKCKGHKPDAEGGNDSAGFDDAKQSSGDNLPFESKTSDVQDEASVEAHVSNSEVIPGKFTITLVKKDSSAFSEEERKELLESMQNDFNEFVKELKDREQENGLSGRNFNNYWSYTSADGLHLHFDNKEDAQEFFERMKGKYFNIEFVMSPQHAIDEEEEKEKTHKWKLPNPFKIELSRDSM